MASFLLLEESGRGATSGEALLARKRGLTAKLFPAKRARVKTRDSKLSKRSTYSIRRRALYLATRSLRAGAPVLIWPTPRATTRSAMKVFSVSPLRCETMTPQPSDWESCALNSQTKSLSTFQLGGHRWRLTPGSTRRQYRSG
jgi:hypothetical protein